MDQLCEDHLQSLILEFNQRVNVKYRKGVEEHGGHLWNMPAEALLDCAIDEAIDQVVYLLTLKEKIHGIDK